MSQQLKDNLTTIALCKNLWFLALSYVLHFLHPCLVLFPCTSELEAGGESGQVLLHPLFWGGLDRGSLLVLPLLWLPPLPWVGNNIPADRSREFLGKVIFFFIF